MCILKHPFGFSQHRVGGNRPSPLLTCTMHLADDTLVMDLVARLKLCQYLTVVSLTLLSYLTVVPDCCTIPSYLTVVSLAEHVT